MLAANYVVCTLVAGAYAGFTSLFPAGPDLPPTLLMGGINGVLYLLSFVLFQRSVERNGVVLSSLFMKLGLLVPLCVSILLFAEMPGTMQIIGFILAVGAIVLMNLNSDEKSKGSMGASLVILLLASGSGDAMSKVFEQWGSQSMSGQFLFYTFFTALILCGALVLIKKVPLGKNELLYGVMIGVPNYFSTRFLLLSLSQLDAVIAYPTFSVATILAVTLMGVLFFHERLTKRQWIALSAILIALVLLNI